jgi:membrane associated rhomboid family serine protease
VEISALFVGVLVLIELIDHLLPLQLDALGIVPRTVAGLGGILFAPLLHGNAAHLAANAFPLFLLMTLLFWDRRYRPEQTLSVIWLASGLGTWLIGRGYAVHIGASGLIYGLVAYLIAAGWWLRNWRSILVGLGVLILYGGIFYGLLPRQDAISWEGHLAGAIAGWWAAKRQHG